MREVGDVQFEVNGSKFLLGDFINALVSFLLIGCYHDTDTMGTIHGWIFSNGSFSDLSTPASMNNGVTPDGSVTAGL